MISVLAGTEPMYSTRLVASHPLQVTTTNSFPAGRLHVHEYWYCAASSVSSEKNSSKVEVKWKIIQ